MNCAEKVFVAGQSDGLGAAIVRSLIELGHPASRIVAKSQTELEFTNQPAVRQLFDKKPKHVKASIRAKVEHPFRVIKRQLGFVKVCYRGLAKNTAQFHTLFALSNLWMARHRLLQKAQG